MDDIIKDALDRFAESQDGSEFNRADLESDIRFSRMGEQWPAEIIAQRQAEGRPCLTINKLPAFVRQVVNESRQNKPGIKVSPVDNGADVETAEVIGGLVRSIERGSDSEIAYDTAIDHAVSGGFGFFRISIDYCHPDSFDLEAKIERVPNALMVHWDVNSTKFDASDWDYGFISDFLTKEQFHARYPDAEAVSFEGDQHDFARYWLRSGEDIRIAEYFLRTEKKRKLLLLGNQAGETQTVRLDELPDMAKRFFARGGIEANGSDKELIREFLAQGGFEVKREREASFYTVKRRIISGVEVLEEEDWPGTTIPICPVWGEEVYIDGRRHFRSLVRDAKDPQAMFNFWRTASTELVALAPKAPFLVEEGGIPKGEEEKWETANVRSHAYLQYSRGTQIPQRQPFAGVPAGALQEAMNASDDIKAITGIYDPSLGARSNETSGKAIMARQRESDVANFHFIDNLSRAIRYCGQVLVEIIPSIYSTRKTIRILGEDSKEKVVTLTQLEDGYDKKDGNERLYNLSVGKYDVTVSSGPSFATQRQETQEMLVEIISRVPDAAPVLGDVLVKHMDFPESDKIARRLQTLLPPAIQQAEAEENKDIPPEAQALITQKDTQIQQLQAQMQQMQGESQAEVMKAKSDIAIKKAAAKTDRNIKIQSAKLDMQIKMTNAKLDLKAKRQAAKQARIDAAKQEQNGAVQ